MFSFKTKAQNLEQLVDVNPKIMVPKFIHFTRESWIDDPETILTSIAGAFSDPVIVRSSGLGEDSTASSLAGAFESYTCASAQDDFSITNAITDVFNSMSLHRPPLAQDRAFVQTLVRDVSMSGVVLSRDLSTGSPYIVINYDDASGRTDTVTAALDGDSHRTLWIFRDAIDRVCSPRFKAVVENFIWLEAFTGRECIDVEFALSHSGDFILFQVRPQICDQNSQGTDRLVDVEALNALADHCEHAMKPKEGLLGETSVLGQMPDWNPAEIIGRTPKPLARELYANLITDDVWAEARALMGYREVLGYPLMHTLAGQPFIDVRASFNSFLPDRLDEAVGSKLVDAWVDRLKHHPQLHDKVEFQVATPTFRFELRDFYRNTYPGLLSKDEMDVYSDLMRSMATRHIRDEDCGRALASEAVDNLEAWQISTRDESLGQPTIRRMLTMCQRLGTLPFAIHARHAFAARTLLHSLEERDALPRGYTERIQRKVPTVASEFLEQAEAVQTSGSFSQFMRRFGHLRPGTYEVSSPRYDEMPLAMLSLPSQKPVHLTQESDQLLTQELHDVNSALRAVNEVDIQAEELLAYFVHSTQERERAKFVFTRTLSMVLERVAAWGRAQGLSADEVGLLSLATVSAADRGNPRGGNQHAIRSELESAQVGFSVTRLIRLPALICSPDDIWVIPILVSQPTFITVERVVAPIVHLHGSREDWSTPIEGAIVAIESADPGFDWIFSRGIAGLVTKFGGTNSHMAIRCAEFGLPAAIGCGDELFDRIAHASMVNLDCLQRYVGQIR